VLSEFLPDRELLAHEAGAAVRLEHLEHTGMWFMF
jgi:hypothetical protein